MFKVQRVLAALAVAVGLAIGVGAPAVAAGADPSPAVTPVDGFGCLGASTSYGVPLPCQLNVTVLQPVCDNDVPYLQYTVDPIGSPNKTVTITWLDAADPHHSVVYANLPLSGRVLWPGAVVDKNGNALDWPGWTKQADGTWVEGDEYDWVRPSATVHFKVNPEATVTVAYPPSTPMCDDNPPTSRVLADDNPSAVLATTGSSDVKPLAFAASGLVLAGALALTLAIVTRRRRRSA